MDSKSVERAYLDAVAFTLDGEIDPGAQFADQVWDHAREAVAQFLARVGEEIPESACLTSYDVNSQLGHDLWLTRNGHGVGFWETSDWSKEWSERLDKIASSMGGAYAYQGDGGLIYVD